MSDLSITPREAPVGRQWDRVMFYAIFAGGIAAGLRVAPAFLFMTPVVALAVWSVRSRGTAMTIQGSVLPAEPLGNFPPAVNGAVAAAVAQLPAGDARTLLGGVIRQARPFFGATSSAFDAAKDDESRSHAATLVVACCDTALELARLDALIASAPRASGSPPDATALDQRYVSARAEFAKRLTDAATALGELYASGIEHGTPASDRVAELAGELRSDAASRSAAKAEVDELLK